ncbi:hypothetical protein ACJ41O_005503 [Fusarium nematophilum]
MSKSNQIQIPAAPRAMRERQSLRRPACTPHGGAPVPMAPELYPPGTSPPAPRGLSGPPPVAPSPGLQAPPPPPGFAPMHHGMPGPHPPSIHHIRHRRTADLSPPFGFTAGWSEPLGTPAPAASPSGAPYAPSPSEIEAARNQLLQSPLNPAATVWIPVPGASPVAQYNQQLADVLANSGPEPQGALEARTEDAQRMRAMTELSRAYQIEDERDSIDAVNDWFWQQCVLGDERRKEEEASKKREEKAAGANGQSRRQRGNITADARIQAYEILEMASEKNIPVTNEGMGEPLSATNQVLTAGAAVTQSICAHLNAFHAYADDPKRCVETNHYCAHLSTPLIDSSLSALTQLDDDVRQCLLYDSDEPHARLIGIEYMITPKLYDTLDPEERRLWHSHVYEVKSGMLIMPNRAVPETAWKVAENWEMDQVVHLYGKAYHLWQTDRGDTLPLGPPRLMTSYTADGQFDFEKRVGDRDMRFGTDYKQKREARRDIPVPVIHDDADQAWKK